MVTGAELFECVRERVAEAVAPAAECVTDRVRRERAPVDTGELRSSIDWNSSGALTVEVSATAPHAAYQDRGSGPFEIRPKNKKALFWDGAAHPVAKVNHPGFSRNNGWFTDAPWDAWFRDCLDAELS